MPRLLHSWVSETTVNGLPQPPVSPLLVEDLDRLVVGVIVEQLVDQRDRRGWRGVRLPGAQRPWDVQRVLLAA